MLYSVKIIIIDYRFYSTYFINSKEDMKRLRENQEQMTKIVNLNTTMLTITVNVETKQLQGSLSDWI